MSADTEQQAVADSGAASAAGDDRSLDPNGAPAQRVAAAIGDRLDRGGSVSLATLQRAADVEAGTVAEWLGWAREVGLVKWAGPLALRLTDRGRRELLAEQATLGGGGGS